MRILIAIIATFWLAAVHAEILENDPRIKISTIEPSRDVGYTVGDILSRTVIMEAPKSLTLYDTSLPIPGYEKKHKGRGTGIEVREVSMEKSTRGDKNIYTLHLSYQVFTTNIVAKPAALPPEFVKFGNNKENFEVRIPSWSFRISPLAVYGSVVVERDMSQFRGPLLLDPTPNQRLLYTLLTILALSMLGLLYILGAYSWLPRMGGPFARAYRDLKKLPATAEGMQQGIARIHQALNTSAGSSVFGADGFIAIKPGFATLKADIERFFALSRRVFFEASAAPETDADLQNWLRDFCRKCRHCERGLK